MPLRVTKQSTNTEGKACADDRQLGIQALEEKRWLEAVGYLEKALESNPDDAALMNSLALAQDGLGDGKAARAALGQAIKAAPDYPDTYRSLALLLIRQGRALEAADHACRAVELDPSDPEAAAILEETHALIRKLKPATNKKGKKRAESHGPTQEEINLRFRKINSALAKSEAARSSTRPRISLCMIVRNEEAFLEDCLRSARDVADEIVIVDTGSRDGTVGIAEAHGAAVYSRKWTDSFADARNSAIERATGDWILILDADERLDPASKKAILRAVSKPSADAYELIFHNYLSGGKNPEVFAHRTCRLFRNRPSYRFRGRVHEQIVPAITASGGTVGRLDAIIHHYGYQPDMVEDRRKHERYIQLLKADLEENPEDIHALYNLGAAYRSCDKPEESLIYLERAAELVTPEHEYAALIFTCMSNALYSTGKAEEALAAAERAERMGIRHPELNYCKGNALLAMKHYEEAALQFQEAIRSGRSGNWIGDAGAFGHKAEYGMATAYMALGDYRKAAEACERAISEKPDDAKAQELLARAYFSLGQADQTEKRLLEMLKLRPDDPKAAMGLGDFYYGQERYREALARYETLLKSGCETPDLRLRLGLSSQALGMFDAAEEHYLRAIQLDESCVQSHVGLGRLYGAQGRAGDALERFIRTLEIDPTYTDAYFSAGDVLCSIGRYQEAANVYQNGVSCRPDNPAGFLVLGNCYSKLGAHEAAVLAYRQALALRPNYPEAAEGLAKAEQALALCRAA